MKTIEEYNAEQEEIEQRKSEEAEPAQGDEPVRTESRYKRGRRWWEQSRWERRH